MVPSLVPSAGHDADLASLLLSGSLPMLVLECSLLLAAAFVWITIVIKSRQVARWRRAEERLERDISESSAWEEVEERARGDRLAIGAPVLAAMCRATDYPEIVEAVAEREIERQNVRVHGLRTTLSSIGAVAPLAGLFGTVYGIIDAFLRIGTVGSASLAVIAPAIGEALITTGTGLFAAIPAVVGYNVLSKRLDDLLAAVDTAARVWAVRVRVSVERRS